MTPRSLACVLALLAACRIQPDRPVFTPKPVEDPKRPAAISAEHVPILPTELYERMQLYQAIRSAAMVDWAPDGKSLLISTRFGSTPQLHRVHEPGGRRDQITFFDEPVTTGRFLADGSIVFAAARGGDENYQLYVCDPKGAIRLLTDGKSRHLLGPVSRSGKRVAASINRDLFILDPAMPATPERVLQHNGAEWSAVDWSPDDTKLLVRRYVSVNESSLHLLDLATKQVTEAAPGLGRAAFGPARFAPDGSILAACDAKGEFLSLARIRDGAFDWVTLDLAADVDQLDVAPDGSIAFTTNEDGVSRLWTLRDGRRESAALSVGVLSGLQFSPDGRTLAFSWSGPDATGDVYTLAGDKLVRWTHSETAGLDGFVKPERISVESFDGLPVPAYVYRPRGAGPHPVLFNIHGGPEGQFRPAFSALIQFYVNELGCAVVAPNVRGSTGYGKRYVALDNGLKREDSVRDIGALLDWVGKQPGLDASRVAVMGGSYGGYMVLACLIHFGERLRAGIDIVGIANFNTFLEKTSGYRQDLRRAEYGDERDPAMREFFARISPSSHAERIRAALLVAHGRNDPRVPFGEAEQIAARVRAQGRVVWTVYADNEGHGFVRKENRDYLNAAIALFLRDRLR